MAVIQPAFDRSRDGVTVVLWETVTNADTCSAITLDGVGALLSSVQIDGNPDSASIAVHGSADGAQFAALADPQGTAIALAADGARSELGTATKYLKPVSDGNGGGSQDLDVRLTLRTG